MLDDGDGEVGSGSETDFDSLESISSNSKNKNKFEVKLNKSAKNSTKTTFNEPEIEDFDMDDSNVQNKKRKNSSSKDKVKAKKKKFDDEIEDPPELLPENTGNTSDEPEGCDDKEDDGVWEDIYGRLRSKDGAILDGKTKNVYTGGKYIPPAIRAKMSGAGTEDKNRKEKLDRLKKQLKGKLEKNILILVLTKLNVCLRIIEQIGGKQHA